VIIIDIKEKDIDKSILAEDTNFIRKGAPAMPMCAVINNIVARIPFPLL
jgi:hypothetical protein